MRHGRVVAEEDLPDIDFVLCGSVAVNLSGARVGKGGGFSDLEYGLLITPARSTSTPPSPPPSTRFRSCASTCR